MILCLPWLASAWFDLGKYKYITRILSYTQLRENRILAILKALTTISKGTSFQKHSWKIICIVCTSLKHNTFPFALDVAPTTVSSVRCIHTRKVQELRNYYTSVLRRYHLIAHTGKLAS